MTHKMNNRLLWLCLSVVMIVPFANDVFISALPAMRAVFNTSHVGLSLTVFLIGLALAQPIYGPLSDRYGRKPVLQVGLLIFLMGSVITVTMQSFNLFLLGRFIQSLGACSAIITGLAIVRDTQHDEKLVKAMGTMMAVIGVCPAVAPLIGSYFTEAFGWKSSFLLLLCLAVFYLIIISFLFKETSVKNLHAAKPKHIIHNYKTIFSNAIYRKYCIISALSYGVLFSFFSLASMYIVHLYHVPVVDFGWLILLNGLVIFSAAVFVPYVSGIFSIKTSVIIGSSLISMGALSMLILNKFVVASLLTFFIPTLIITLGVGFIRPSAVVGALSQTDKKLAGTAVAGFNFCAFVGGSIGTSFSGHLHLPINFALFATLAGSCALLLSFRHESDC
jgi:MFS transporter, DHA1 family, multidrug resistance protein